MNKVLNAFLHYGYVPNKSDANFDTWLPYSSKEIRSLQKKWKNASLEEIVAFGSNRLKQLIDENIPCKNIVPLSGGLDSRAILGLLLQCVSNEEIKIITCGVPGTWDYDIGIQIAEKLNIESETIDLRSVIWETEDLVNFAGRFERPTVLLDAYMYSKVFEIVDKGCTCWIGYMGDPLAGSHLSNNETSNWRASQKYFVLKERFINGNTSLTQDDFNPISFLPRNPILKDQVLSYVEQLDFVIRQYQFIKPQVLLDDYDNRTPFLNESWVNFLLSLPRKYRFKQVAYKKILLSTFPDLFALPTKNNAGLPVGTSKARKAIAVVKKRAKQYFNKVGLINHYVNPNLNYIDFAQEFRSGSLKQIAKENLKELKKRNIVRWIDIDGIWEKHQNGKSDFNKELALLLSLEINIKAGNF